MDRHDLYELCVTDAARTARFLHAVHGRGPTSLREDYAGSGALARAWAADYGPAIAVDNDAEPLRRCLDVPRLAAVVADVRRCRRRADIIAATNFPLGYSHTRRDLLAYLRHARGCLNPRGVFVADMYGGSDAFTPCTTIRRFRGPKRERIEYTWEQRTASSLTGRVFNAIHFKVSGFGRATTLRDAFTYDWRLWGVPELVDAYREAGFRRIEVHDRLGGAIDHTGALHARPLTVDEPLDDPFVAYIVGRH
jgi:hypothetical protein